MGRAGQPPGSLVAIAPKLWNQIGERIEDLEDAVSVYRGKWELASGLDTMVDLSADTFEEWRSGELPSTDSDKRTA